MCENIAIIKALKEMSSNLHSSIFGFTEVLGEVVPGPGANAKIDMSELILAGHSYGAISMIATGAKLGDAE